MLIRVWGYVIVNFYSHISVFLNCFVYVAVSLFMYCWFFSYFAYSCLYIFTVKTMV